MRGLAGSMAGRQDFGMRAASATGVFGTRPWVRREQWAFVFGVSGGLAAMVAAAQVRIPVLGTDVPMTLQSFGVYSPWRQGGRFGDS